MTSYLEKRALYPALIAEKPNHNLFNVIVIPCYNEPDILGTLRSLKGCDVPNRRVEVIIVVNSSEEAEEMILGQNEISITEIEEFKSSHPDLFYDLHILHIKNLAKKTAGVGVARKIGMDEAIYRFESLEKEIQTNGVITCLDADCTVKTNYLVEIENCFLTNVKCPGASIKYAHDIEPNTINANEIIDYELHLRYYNQGLKWAGFPYAYQTVGSSMVVRGTEYQRQGGMNKRKAGEDFYFLHKFIQLDGFRHISETTVYPSSRTSDRVPFGTGRAMLQMKESISDYETYRFSAFKDLKYFVGRLDGLYQDKENIESFVEGLESSLSQYLIEKTAYLEDWQGIINNTKSLASFRKRFFVWMNAFWVMKFLNYDRTERGGGEVFENANMLYEKIQSTMNQVSSKKDLLKLYRLLDRE